MFTEMSSRLRGDVKVQIARSHTERADVGEAWPWPRSAHATGDDGPWGSRNGDQLVNQQRAATAIRISHTRFHAHDYGRHLTRTISRTAALGNMLRRH